MTVSFDIESDADRDLEFFAYQNSGLSIAENGTVHVDAGEAQRVSFTATVKDYGAVEGCTAGGIGLLDSLPVKAVFSIRRIKIEVGTKATDWSLAPNDPALTGNNLLNDSARIRKSAGGFIQIRTSEAFQGLEGLPVTVSFEIESDAERDIRYYAYQGSGLSIATSGTFHVTADAPQQIAFTTEVKDYGLMEGLTTGGIGLYDSSSEKANFSIRNIKIEIGTKATEWALAPNDPLITGNNLLTDSLRGRTSKNGFINLPVREALAGQEGQPITVSFELKGVPGQEIQVYAYQGSGISIAPMTDGLKIPITTNGYSRYFFTATVKDYGEKEGQSTGSIAFYDAGTEKKEFTIRQIKIEVGYTPTEWSFAPDDPLGKGQNLVQNSAEERTSANGFLEIPLGDALAGYEGMTVSVSFFAKAEEERSILVFAYGDTGVSISHDSTSALAIPMTKDYVRFWFTTTVKDYGPDTSGEEEGGMIVFYDQSGQKVNFSVRQLKIELGESLSDWTPYPGE